MARKQYSDDRISTVRELAASKGYQLRRADEAEGFWHLVDPLIDAKTYGFAFTKPHTFTLAEVEEILSKRPDCDVAQPYKFGGG